MVNANIRANKPVVTRLMSQEAAVEAGAMALFGEKYGDEVRVVSMGEGKTMFSVELCGGTHVRRTGDIGLFKIVSESAVAAGVRRIEAVVAGAAEHWVEEQAGLLARAAQSLKASPAEIPARIEALLEDRRKLEKELADLRRQMATGGGAASANKDVAGITFAGRQLDGVPAKDLKGMADDIKKQIGSGVVALFSNAEGKASLVVARHRRLGRQDFRRRSGQGRLGSLGRQGRRRPSRHGPGRRSRCHQGCGSPGRHRSRHRRQGVTTNSRRVALPPAGPSFFKLFR